MGRFTKGSSWGWQGAVPYPSLVRALDVTLEGDAPEPVSIVLEPVREWESAPAGDASQADALVEWGAGQGTAHRAWVDVGRGVTFSLVASRLIVGLRNIGSGYPLSPPVRLRASALLGATRGLAAPVRSLRAGGLPPGNETEPLIVPAFASHLSVSRTPEVPLAVRMLDAQAIELARAGALRAADRAILVPPGVEQIVIRNVGSAPVGEVRAIFELSL
ncbi:MAG: hypothetical protein IT384_18930 [Deltaproteobacteria bacterium]|nr:hypothetical protein [Deltaproteobacteria bacterium]